MPHSAPVQTIDGSSIASLYAELLGVPAIMVNKVGMFHSPSQIPDIPSTDNIFPGKSAIADSNGSIKANLGSDEGILVEDVHLDSSLKTKLKLQCDNQWISYKKTPPITVQKYFEYIENIGATWYSESSERKQRALSISCKD